MAIQRLKGYKNPGDENMPQNPMEVATDLNADKGPSPWDEMGRQIEEMNKLQVKEPTA